MLRRRLPFIIGIPLLLLLLVGVIILVPRLTSPNPGVQMTPTVTTAHLSAADAVHLERTLNSSDMRVQATALVPDLANVYLQQGKPLIPPGATIRIVLNTETCKDMSCKVNAVVTEKGGKTTTFVLYLDDGTGQWLIAGTSEVR